MISVEKIQKKYYINFIGNKKYFSVYINKIMKLSTKDYDFTKQCWFIDEKELGFLKILFNNIEFLDEIKPQNKKTYFNKNLKDIGIDLKLPPFEYQKEAINFIINNNASLLVLPCGAGKTPVTIGAFNELLKHKKIKGPGLIVVKASLKTQWLKEVSKFSNYKATIIQSENEIGISQKGKIKRRKDKIKTLSKIKDKAKIKEIRNEIKQLEKDLNNIFNEQFKGYDLYITNYETLTIENIKKQLHKLKIDFICLDEIQYIKSKSSKRSKAVHEFSDIKIRIGATATPIQKNAEDIEGLFKFLDPSLFPNSSKFANNYLKFAGYGRVIGIKNEDHLKKKIKPYIFLKTKEEISNQLPKLVVYQRYCNMTIEQQTTHDKIMEDLDTLRYQDQQIRQKCKNNIEAKNNSELQKIGMQILALQTFAQELADTPELLSISESDYSKSYCPKNLISPKINMLIELIEEIIDSGEKVCVFSRYEKVQQIITNAIKKAKIKTKIAYVNGSIKDKDRFDQVYNKFQNSNDYKVLLMSDAGCEGINLSKTKYLIELDLADSYLKQTQRHGRLERADSIHDNVIVYQLIAQDSFDEIALKIIEKKEKYDYDIIKTLK